MGCSPSTVKNARAPRKFAPIPDRFKNIQEVQSAVRAAGLESSNLILGVDFTKSNTWTGRESFNGKSLHHIAGPESPRNPYEQVIDIIGRTLEEFDDDRLIPAYGFGDATTGSRKCFPFNPSDVPSHGVQAVLERYQEVAAMVDLAGPTSFAPVIHRAIEIVREEQAYHILVIIADGQVTDASPTGETARAIIEASHYPLSIVVVGVGDGPWGAMEEYDDQLTERVFDNFQFVDFNRVKIEAQAAHRGDTAGLDARMEARFALNALMEIPDQYSFIKDHGLLNTSSFPRLQHREEVMAPAPCGARAMVPVPTAQQVSVPAVGTPSCIPPSSPPAKPQEQLWPHQAPPTYMRYEGPRPAVGYAAPAVYG